MKTKMAVLFGMGMCLTAQCAPTLSISYVGVTNNNVYQETAPTIRLAARNETPGAMEYVYWTTDLTFPKDQWVLVWLFPATGTDSINLPIPPSWNQVYFYTQEQ